MPISRSAIRRFTYARHLATGRIAPTRVLAEVDYGDHTPAPADILRKLADAADAGAALESFNPPHRGFQALKAKLAALRDAATRPEPIEAPAAKPAKGKRVEKPITRLRRRKRSTSCSPIWSAGAGCRTTSATPM